VEPSERDDDLARMTLVEHLAELRRRLVISVVVVALGAVGVFVLYNPILEAMLEPYCRILEDQECTVYITSPLEGLAARLKVAGYGGVFLASPVLLWQLWRFVTPALHKRERRYAIPFVLTSVALFGLGLGLGIAVFPRGLEFIIGIAGSNVTTLFSPEKYITFLLRVLLAFGIAFEFPILLVFLQLAGVLEPSTLRRYRRHAIVAIFAFCAIITPTQDPLTLLAMAVPMCAFYEASILIGRLLRRRGQ
jgi:sec-independent protein translocase protein TatC